MGVLAGVGLTVAIDDALLVDGLVFRIELSERLNVLAIAESHGLRVGLLGISALVGLVYLMGGLGNRGLKTLVADIGHILPLADLVAICCAVLLKAVRCVPGTPKSRVSILRARLVLQGLMRGQPARGWCF